MVRISEKGEISCLAVEPDERRKGYGSEIMELLRQHNKPYTLSCLDTNHKALLFYQSIPWLCEGKVETFISRRKQIPYTLVYFHFPKA